MEHIEGTFQGYQDLNLYYQCWLPASEPRAVLLVNHGLAEHSGRYTNLVNYFGPRGYSIYGFDHRGHGRSPGLRGYVEDFSSFVNDLGIFLSIIRSKYQNTKIFIIAHSVGGTIATAYAVNNQDKFDGLILSGPTLKAGASVPPGLIFIAPLLSLLIPKVGLYTIDASAISRDKAVVAAYVNDPLVYQGKIRTRLGVEIIKTMQVLPSQMSRIHLPVMILHGTKDRLSEPKGSQILYDRVKSDDKTLKLYDGFFHEIFNEPDHEQVFGDVETWLTAHL
jgi:alpha-beta hydrolase superfamily lysophospholipase